MLLLLSSYSSKVCPIIRYIVLISHWTAECTPADDFKYAGENIVFASGSPFQNVDLGIPYDPRIWKKSDHLLDTESALASTEGKP